MDGFVDCINGKDEEPDAWMKCGDGATTRYVEKEGSCQDVFLCPGHESRYIPFEQLCDRIPTCQIENEICKISRNLASTWNTVVTTKNGKVKHLSYCLPGMESLGSLTAPCTP